MSDNDATRGITGPDVHVHVAPGAPPAIAMTVLVSPADQRWIDNLRFQAAQAYQRQARA